MDSKLDVFFYSMDALGHVNACLGLAQELANRGNTITFLTSPAFEGHFKKFNFNEIPLTKESKDENKDDDPLKTFAAHLLTTGLLSNKTSLEKNVIMSTTEEKTQNENVEEVYQFDFQIKKAIDEHKPDVIIMEHFHLAPSVIKSGIPWIRLFSFNPLSLYNSNDLPPFKSGYSVHDRTGWEEFIQTENHEKSFINSVRKVQNKLFEKLGYEPVEYDGNWLKSEYLNIYGFPEELDYDDIAPRPEKTIRVDSFFRHEPELYELPAEFKNKLKPNDKLIYVSMGSLGSIDVELQKRLVNALKDTPHKYIFSKGPRHDEFELAENMYGERYLPQTSILPMVDLVITHGGNNSISEALFCGKPMIVMPLFADQYDNAQRIDDKNLGIRMEAYGFKDQELVDTVNKLLFDEDLKQRLEQVKTRMQSSKSKEKVCELIENLVQSEWKNKSDQIES